MARPDRRTRGSSQKRDLGDPSPALLDGCNGLRTRSLNDPRRVPASNRANRHTLKPLHDTCMRCKPMHPSPSARRFRLLLNGLAASALRRMFCSDEGACVRFGLPAGFIEPCLPTKTDKLPSGDLWLHEIKHDGFRVIARKDGDRVRLYSRPGNDMTRRFPLIAEALTGLRSRSCIIDGEAVACDDNGLASFDRVCDGEGRARARRAARRSRSRGCGSRRRGGGR